MPNKIKEWLAHSEDKSQTISKELFSNENVKVKTELEDKAILGLSKIFFNHEFLVNSGLYKTNEETPFSKYAKEFMTLKISRQRKSRQEFTDSVKEDKSEEVSNAMGKFSQDKRQ